MKIEIISRPEQLASLREEWDTLARKHGHPLLSYNWLAITANCYCQNGELRVVVVRHDSGVRAIAPLMLTRVSGIRTLVLLGHAVHFEPGGFLYHDVEDLRSLFKAVLTLNYPVVLHRLCIQQREVEVLDAADELSKRLHWSASPGSPFICIQETWEDFESSITSRRRSDLRRARRRAEAGGTVQIEVLSPAPEDVQESLEQLIKVEALGWKGRDRTALLYDLQRRHFYERYSEVAADLGILRLGLLRIGDDSVAGMLGVEFAQCLWILKIGHDETHARCSPGALLMHESVRHAFEAGLQRVEFLGNDDDWLRVWSRGVHEYKLARLYSGSLGSQLAQTINRTGKIIRQIRKRTRRAERHNDS